MDELEAELAALRLEYAASLSPKARAIVVALATDREEARALAHRLRGTAGSFGFAEVSAAAGALEDALERGEDVAHLVAGLITAASRATAR